MNAGKRALVAAVAITAGWARMVIAYDKPQWFFQISGVVGAVLVLGAAIWWFVSARRAQAAKNKAHGEEPNDA
jgi:ABC-type nickel/cobalt efflux system permease component RcnA